MKSLKKFNHRRDERMKNQNEEENDGEKFGLSRMTKESIKKLCKKNDLYLTPNLNDVLYLHYQGYQAIESLEEYTSVKCLWLESNAIGAISGLEKQSELRCLFLHHNLIKKIENLQYCRRLDTINLSYNFITTIENCDSDILPELSSLNLSHNKIQKLNDLEHLKGCKLLSVLDLSHNRIDDILLVGILAKMPELRVLVLTGNPVVSQIPSYRKTLINECLNLTYLDSRPVFDRDRACAVAWKRGGYEEEQREMARWNKAERKKIRDGVNATLTIRRQLRQSKETTDNDNDIKDEGNGVTSSDSSNSNENYNMDLIPSTDEEDDNEVKQSSKENVNIANDMDGENIADKWKSVENELKCSNDAASAVAHVAVGDDDADIDDNDHNDGLSNLFNEVDNDQPIQKELYVAGTNSLDDFGKEVDILEKNRSIYDRLAAELEELGEEKGVIEMCKVKEMTNVDEIEKLSIHDLITLPEEKIISVDNLKEKTDDNDNLQEMGVRIHTKYKLKIQEISESLILSNKSDTENREASSKLLEVNSTQPMENFTENLTEKQLKLPLIDELSDTSINDSLLFDADKSMNNFLSSTTIDSTDSSPSPIVFIANKENAIRMGDCNSSVNYVPSSSNSSELNENNSIVTNFSDTPPNLSENDFSNIENNSEGENSSTPPNDSTISPLNKGQLIQTLLTSKSSLFDLSTDELNREIEILNDNSQNFITEVINMVYENRQLYNELDLVDCQVDEEKNVEINIDQQKSPNHRSGIRFYCENVDKLLINDNCFSPIYDEDGDGDNIFRIATNNPNDNDDYEDDDDGNGDNGSIADEFIEILSDENEEDYITRSPERYYTPPEFISNNKYELDTNKLNTNLLKLQKNNNAESENAQDQTSDNENIRSPALINDHGNKSPPEIPKPIKQNHQNVDAPEDTLDTMTDFKFIKNLICEAPNLNDFMASVPFEKHDQSAETNELEGYDGEEEYQDACGGTSIKDYSHYDCPEYQKFLKYMENLDHELYKNVHSVMLNASLEYEMLDELNKYGDPEGDNETDIIKRAEKYANEFKNHLSEEHRKKFNDQNAFWKKDLPDQQNKEKF